MGGIDQKGFEVPERPLNRLRARQNFRWRKKIKRGKNQPENSGTNDKVPEKGKTND